jgi:hypothetical protein
MADCTFYLKPLPLDPDFKKYGALDSTSTVPAHLSTSLAHRLRLKVTHPTATTTRLDVGD